MKAAKIFTAALAAGIFFSLTLFSAESQDRPPRYGETPEDSIQCVRNLSLYQEYWNQGNRQLAFEPWREVFFNCPQASQNTFIRGATLLKMQYAAETDPVKRDQWVDTLMMLYDKRIEYFGHVPTSRKGMVLGRKAVELYQLRPNNVKDIYDWTTESIELERNSSQADVLLVNFQSLIRLVEAGVEEQEKVLEVYERNMSIIEHNIREGTGNVSLYESAKSNIDIMFEPFATCENLIALFGPQFEQRPEDVELLEKITEMLDNSGCTDDELYYSATLNLHRLKPTAQSAFLMGRMENARQNYAQAINFFEEAVELYEDDDDKFSALILMTDISFRQLRQMPQARSYARRAAEKDPENGRPYLLIGEMYAASASQCGDDDITRAAVYWAAVDKFIRARNVDEDPIIQERATQLINTYRQHFPNREETFFHGLDDGETFRVECWINVTTTVRSR